MPSPLRTLPFVHFSQHFADGVGLNVLRLRTTAYAVCVAISAVTAGESLGVFFINGQPLKARSTASIATTLFTAILPSSWAAGSERTLGSQQVRSYRRPQ